MTKKIEKKKNENESTKQKISDEKKVDVYFQINRISFQQNFKVLMSHYKNETHSSHS